MAKEVPAALYPNLRLKIAIKMDGRFIV